MLHIICKDNWSFIRFIITVSVLCGNRICQKTLMHRSLCEHVFLLFVAGCCCCFFVKPWLQTYNNILASQVYKRGAFDTQMLLFFKITHLILFCPEHLKVTRSNQILMKPSSKILIPQWLLAAARCEWV